MARTISQRAEKRLKKQTHETIIFWCSVIGVSVALVTLGAGIFFGVVSHHDATHQPPSKPDIKIDKSSHQALLDNQGTITGLTMKGNSIVGTPAPGSGALITTQDDVHGLSITGAVVCNISSWNAYLDCIKAESGNRTRIRDDINTLEERVESSLRKHPEFSPEKVAVCRDALKRADKMLLAHVKDERDTTDKLRSQPPPCSKASLK